MAAADPPDASEARLLPGPGLATAAGDGGGRDQELRVRRAEASICEACFVDGLEDRQVEALFNAARESDYRQIADEARTAGDGARPRARRVQPEVDVARLRRRLAAVSAIDFFGAPGREIAEQAVAALERIDWNEIARRYRAVDRM